MDCVPCQEGFDTRIILRPNTGTELRIFLGVFMEDRDFVRVMPNGTMDSKTVDRLVMAICQGV